MKKLFVSLLAILSVGSAYAQDYSGTLPVMFINTVGPIETKYDYVDATYYIDAMGIEGFESLASEASPLPLQIRGRGNWTWFGPFEKKGYKIKLEKGQRLLGMESNKHFALLAHADGGQKAYFRNTAGFALSRYLGLEWTPSQQPIELVLNGQYEGLYFLTETVRVGKRRVNIVEQKDYETKPDSITGGWLVEIDNADDEHQIAFPLEGTELTRFCVTYNTPENLSEEQYNYLYNEFMTILQTVYTPDKTSNEWEQHIDVESLVKYYMVNEIIDHLEAFLGSCFLHKDYGETLWKFGPVWDLGHAFNDWHEKDKFIWQYKHETEEDWEPCIMEELAKFPHLQQLIKDCWNEIYPDVYSYLEECLTEFASQIEVAAVSDRQRWPKYGTDNAQHTLQLCLNSLNAKRSFLVSQWGDGTAVGISSHTAVAPDNEDRKVFNIMGQQVTKVTRQGLYIRNGRKVLVK